MESSSDDRRRRYRARRLLANYEKWHGECLGIAFWRIGWQGLQGSTKYTYYKLPENKFPGARLIYN